MIRITFVLFAVFLAVASAKDFIRAGPAKARGANSMDQPGKRGSEIVYFDLEGCLVQHNDYRRKHHVPLLDWDEDLAMEAEAWAKHLIDTGKFEHATTDEGENLAASTGQMSCEQATDLWYNEVKDYDYGNPVFSGKTGHFTQVVWKATEYIGVGIATNGAKTVVVARYSPAGNVQGQFAANVLRP